MDPQYITNTNPPPAQSVLQYSVSPDTVYVSTDEQTMYANLTITVFNPQSSAVACQAFQFGFYVGAGESDLTPEATGIQSSSSQAGWTISKQAQESPDDPSLYAFSAAPSAPYSLGPNDSLIFGLAHIQINSTVEDSVPIVITEVTGANTTNPDIVQGQLEISQVAGSLAITSFEPAGQPGLFSPGSDVTLNWKLLGADKWQLFGSDSAQPLYDSWSSPPDADSYTDQPQEDTTYTLIAWAGQLFTTQSVDVMVMAARFVGAASVSPSEVAYNAMAILAWKTRFATRLQISAPGFSTLVFNAAPGLYDYFPQAPNNEVSLPPNLYTLTVFGPGNSQDQQQVMISIQLPTPAINNFTATPPMFDTGKSVNLTWETSYATIAVLMENSSGAGSPPMLPKIVALNSSEYPNSVYPVTPAGLTAYTLLVKGQGQSSAQAVALEVEGTFSCSSPTAFCFDGTYLWVATGLEGLGYIIMLDQNCAQVGQPLRSAADFLIPQMLAFDGTYVWITDLLDSCVTAMRATSNGPVLQSPPLQYVNPSLFPLAITYDDVNRCLWVACAQEMGSDVLLKLTLNNGTLQNEQFPMLIRNTTAIVSDGEYVWAAGFNQVTGIRTSDASAAFTVNVGNDPDTSQLPPSGLVYDGTHLWVRNCGDAQLLVLNPASGAQVGNPIPIGMGSGVSMLAYDGTYIWTGGTGLTIFQASDGAALFNAPLGHTPSAFCFDGSHMWVADNTGNMITKFGA